VPQRENWWQALTEMPGILTGLISFPVSSSSQSPHHNHQTPFHVQSFLYGSGLVGGLRWMLTATGTRMQRSLRSARQVMETVWSALICLTM
jgi:hypothetical protein